MTGNSLDRPLWIYGRHSNEVSNAPFSQKAYVQNRGTALGLAGDSLVPGCNYHGMLIVGATLAAGSYLYHNLAKLLDDSAADADGKFPGPSAFPPCPGRHRAPRSVYNGFIRGERAYGVNAGSKRGKASRGGSSLGLDIRRIASRSGPSKP